MNLRILASAALLGLLSACGGSQGGGDVAYTRTLPVPSQLAPVDFAADGTPRFELTAQAGTTEFFEGNPTGTYGYNGAFLGPTLRLRRGQAVDITLKNQLPESDHDRTNLHLHGLKVPGALEVVPEGMTGLGPGESVTFRVTPDQPAATLWYHPHPHGHTGQQVYMGMAGLLLLDDAVSDALPLPKSYGVDDIPLVFQDRRFNSDGSFAYMDSMGDRDFMMGGQVLVNGAVRPFVELPAGLVRLRLLNGSSARRYDFTFADGRRFWQIASDGGFLQKPLPVTTLMLGPAERAEVLVDLSADLGRDLELRSAPFASAEQEHGAGQGTSFPLMQLRVTRPGTALPIPASLAEVGRIPESEATTMRQLRLEDTGDGVINGLKFDMDRVDAFVQDGSTEIWAVKNYAGDIAHPFHIHGGQFQILSRNGALPPEGERGWKDTFLVQPFEQVRVILRFRGIPGRHFFHCHILEHEDMGMMGQYEVDP